MNTLARLFAMAVVSLGTSACTSFTAQRVDLDDDARSIPRGIIVPDEVPLLVVANGQVSTVMVRSPDRATAVRFGTFLAKHDVTLEFFANGGLNKLTSNQDATALPLKLVEIAKAVADKLPTGLGLSGSSGTATSLQIYRIVFSAGEIVRLEPLLNTANFPPPRLEFEGSVIDMEPISDVNSRAGEATPDPPARGRNRRP